MPIFKNEEEAQEVHKGYIYDTDWEGKFSPVHGGWLRSKRIIDWMPKDQPQFLGIGCNSGGLERAIMRARPGSVAYGVDIQPVMIMRAQQKGVLAKVAKAEELPFPNNYFDVVILSEILEHVFDPKKVLNEALRVLKPKGLLIGSVPHPKGKNSMKKSIAEHAYHTRIFTKQTLTNLFKMLGNFKIVEITFQDRDTGMMDTKTPQWFAFKGTK